MNPKNGLYGGRGQHTPYGSLDQPFVPQRLAVNNAYVDNKISTKRKRRRGVKGQKSAKFGGDPTVSKHINDRDILIMDKNRASKRRHTRQNSTTVLQSTLKVTSGLNGLGDIGEPKHKTRDRFEYVGFSKTAADKNLLGENDRTMVPVLNGGLVDVINRSPHVIPAHTLLKVDFPEDEVDAMRIKKKVQITGEDPKKVPLFLSAYDPKSQKEVVKFLTEAVRVKNSNEAKVARDPERVRTLPVCEANRFADMVTVVGALFIASMEAPGSSSEEVYQSLVNGLNTGASVNTHFDEELKESERALQYAFRASAKKDVDDAYRMRIEAVTRLFSEKPSVGSPFTEERPDLSKAKLPQLVRYFLTKDNALEGMLGAIKSICSIETNDVVAISLNESAPSDPMRILILC